MRLDTASIQPQPLVDAVELWDNAVPLPWHRERSQVSAFLMEEEKVKMQLHKSSLESREQLFWGGGRSPHTVPSKLLQEKAFQHRHQSKAAHHGHKTSSSDL